MPLSATRIASTSMNPSSHSSQFPPRPVAGASGPDTADPGPSDTARKRWSCASARTIAWDAAFALGDHSPTSGENSEAWGTFAAAD